ncbi:MAG: hypothetical protein QOF14_311 [Hyphomicrobiales bacterium]|jgi:hypothetical protein|nr:hypothetical protein [Hyphomicrobiales bacterium]
MVRIVMSGALLAAALVLAGCEKLGSEYHGRWYCGEGIVFEMTETKVMHTGPGRDSFWSAEIKSLEDANGGKRLTLSAGPMRSMWLKREGNNLRINRTSCLRA